jgi:hypothetical protein
MAIAKSKFTDALTQGVPHGKIVSFWFSQKPLLLSFALDLNKPL